MSSSKSIPKMFLNRRLKKEKQNTRATQFFFFFFSSTILGLTDPTPNLIPTLTRLIIKQQVVVAAAAAKTMNRLR